MSDLASILKKLKGISAIKVAISHCLHQSMSGRLHKARQCLAALTPHTHLDRSADSVVAASNGALGGDLTSTTDTHTKANVCLSELKTQQTHLEAKLGNDYGLEEPLGPLWTNAVRLRYGSPMLCLLLHVTVL